MPRSYSSMALIQRVVDLVAASGRDASSLAKRAGIEPSRLAEPNALIPFHAALRFYALASRELDDPCVGLRAVLEADPRSYGVTGFVLLNSPTLGEGLETILGMSNAPNTAFEVRLSRGRHHDDLVIDLLEEVDEGADLFVQDVLGGIAYQSVQVTGGEWAPHAVELTASMSCDATLHHRVFGDTVRFDAGRNAILYRPEDLARPIPGADPSLLTHLRSAVEAQVVQRRAASGQEEDYLRLAECSIDLVRGEVHRSGERYKLTTKERAILDYLARHANETVTHRQLEEDVWGLGKHVVSHAPAVAIRRLRQKLEANPAEPVSLVTVFGEGWKLVVPEAGRQGV